MQNIRFQSPEMGMIEKCLKSFSEEEKSQIRRVIEEHPTALEGFTRILQLFKTKLDSLMYSQPLNAHPVAPPVELISTTSKVNGLSFNKPRKKLDMQITSSSILLLNGSKIETQYDLQTIERVLCLPTPQKAKKQWTFIIFFTKASISFSFLDDVTLTHSDVTFVQKDSPSKDKMITILQHFTNTKVIEPKASVFMSNKKTHFVECYLKAKEGFLFFLGEGIFFGMTQLLFVPLSNITKLSITDVRKTFSVTVECKDNSVHSFQLIDESEYGFVSYYIQKVNNLFVNSAQHNNNVQNQPTPRNQPTPVMKTEKKEELQIKGDDEESDDDSQDEDFAAHSESDSLPEDYDEHYMSDAEAHSQDNDEDEEENDEEDDDDDGEEDALDEEKDVIAE